MLHEMLHVAEKKNIGIPKQYLKKLVFDATAFTTILCPWL